MVEGVAHSHRNLRNKLEQQLANEVKSTVNSLVDCGGSTPESVKDPARRRLRADSSSVQRFLLFALVRQGN